jgi:hypothetical protein
MIKAYVGTNKAHDFVEVNMLRSKTFAIFMNSHNNYTSSEAWSFMRFIPKKKTYM